MAVCFASKFFFFNLHLSCTLCYRKFKSDRCLGKNLILFPIMSNIRLFTCTDFSITIVKLLFSHPTKSPMCYLVLSPHLSFSIPFMCTHQVRNNPLFQCHSRTRKFPDPICFHPQSLAQFFFVFVNVLF